MSSFNVGLDFKFWIWNLHLLSYGPWRKKTCLPGFANNKGADQPAHPFLQGEHSAILLTFIKLSFVIKIFVLSFFEWPFYTDFTVFSKLFVNIPSSSNLPVLIFITDEGRSLTWRVNNQRISIESLQHDGISDAHQHWTNTQILPINTSITSNECIFITYLVLVIFLSLYSLQMKVVAWPEGSIIRGYLLNLFNMMAFSVQRSSAGRALACHLRRSSAFDRYWNITQYAISTVQSLYKTVHYSTDLDITVMLLWQILPWNLTKEL